MAVLIACLAALALWVALDGNDRSGPAAAVQTQTAANSQAAASGAAEKPAELPGRSVLPKILADPFSRRSWLPSAPKLVAAAAKPAVPVAPPLPYRFAGQLLLDSGMQVYLARGDEIIPVKQGDTVDGQYRVESVKPTSMTLLHLASNTPQVMEFDPIKDPDLAVPPINTAASRGNSPQAAPAPAATVAASVAPSAAPTQPARLRWDGPSSAKAGASFDVALRVTSGEQIRSAPMLLKFDPAVLQSVSVRPGRYFDPEQSGNFGYRVNPDGSIFVGAASKKGAPASDAELLVLTFKPIKPSAAAVVTLAALNLQSAAGRAIAYGSVTPFKTTITP